MLKRVRVHAVDSAAKATGEEAWRRTRNRKTLRRVRSSGGILNFWAGGGGGALLTCQACTLLQFCSLATNTKPLPGPAGQLENVPGQLESVLFGGEASSEPGLFHALSNCFNST